MIKYIDFDGVILDTSPLLFEKWRAINRTGLTEEDKIAYVKKQDWQFILNNSPVINDSLYFLRQFDKETTAILSTIHSLENEGTEKIKFLRAKGITLPIILVPYLIDKANMVIAENNILVDDRVHNLDVWRAHDGESVFFNKCNLDYDEWHQKNDKYPKINTLNDLDKIKVRKRK